MLLTFAVTFVQNRDLLSLRKATIVVAEAVLPAHWFNLLWAAVYLL
jgi:hypothetical protein